MNIQINFQNLVLIFIALIIAMLFITCKSGPKQDTASGQILDNRLIAFAEKEYGDDYEILLNSTNEFACVVKYKKNRPNDITPTLNYKLVEIESMEIVFQDIVPKGTLKWYEDYIISVKAEGGIPGPDGKPSKRVNYRYDIKLGKKYNLILRKYK